jgi:hypothetical protein
MHSTCSVCGKFIKGFTECCGKSTLAIEDVSILGMLRTKGIGNKWVRRLAYTLQEDLAECKKKGEGNAEV